MLLQRFGVAAADIPVLISATGETTPMIPDGSPTVDESNPTDLCVRQSLRGGGTFTLICSESKVTFTGIDAQGQPLRWACDLVGGPKQKSIVQTVDSDHVGYSIAGTSYQLKLLPDAGSCQQLSNGAVRLTPNPSGKLVLLLGE